MRNPTVLGQTSARQLLSQHSPTRGEWTSPGEPIHPGEDKGGTEADRLASRVDRHQSWAQRPELISGRDAPESVAMISESLGYPVVSRM